MLFKYPSNHTERSPVQRGLLIRTAEKRQEWLIMALYMQLAYRELQPALDVPATDLCRRAIDHANETLIYHPLPVSQIRTRAHSTD